MQSKGRHGQSREPQVEGKGKVGSTQIKPHQHQAVAGRGAQVGPSPILHPAGRWRQETATYEPALVKDPNFPPDTIPRDGAQGKEWDRTYSAPTEHRDHLSHLCQQHLPQPPATTTSPFTLGPSPSSPRTLKSTMTPLQPTSSTPAVPSSASPATPIATDATSMSPAPRGPQAGASTQSQGGSRPSHLAHPYTNTQAWDCLCLCCLQPCAPQSYLHNK